MTVTASGSVSAATVWPQAASRCASNSSTASNTANDPSTSAASNTTAISQQQSALESSLATLRRASSSVSGAGRWLDHASSTAVAALHATSKQRMSIEIHTQEGDVVRIQLSDRVAIDASAAQVTNDGGSASAQQISVSESQNLRVSVQGNLNPDELAAINNVLTNIDSLAQDFFAGDMNSAFNDAENINMDGAQLSDVAVSLSQSEHVSVAAANSNNLPTSPSQTAATSTQSAAQSISVPSTTTSAPAEQTVPGIPAADETAAIPVTVAPVSSAIPAVSDTPASSSALDSIVQYVAKLTENVRASEQGARIEISSHEKLDALLARIQAKRTDSANLSDAVSNTPQSIAPLANAQA